MTRAAWRPLKQHRRKFDIRIYRQCIRARVIIVSVAHIENLIIAYPIPSERVEFLILRAAASERTATMFKYAEFRFHCVDDVASVRFRRPRGNAHGGHEWTCYAVLALCSTSIYICQRPPTDSERAHASERVIFFLVWFFIFTSVRISILRFAVSAKTVSHEIQNRSSATATATTRT